MADTMLQTRMGYLCGNLTRCSTPLLSMQHGDRRGQNFPQNAPLLAHARYSSPWTRVVSTTTRALEEDMQDTRIIETELRREAEQSYLSYAMSVIVGRALPDVRDGLKPVHRRILYAMDELGLQPNKPHRKCARVVGEVLGKYHPHGDTAVYDALVRMVQEFSMRIPLVDGHGNFGSLDDDPPAAMRYTECRLQPFAAASLLSDLRSETVDMLPNFDNSVMEPSVLPARIPNLLINGSQGIAVGIATRIPPHNLIEVMDGLKALIENPKISVQELMKYIPGPDFPTGGEILKNEGLRDAYKTGKGSILVRAKMHIEETSKKRTVIVISELPYQTNKASLVEQIANLVDDGKITGISDIRDESDRSGMRVVIEIKQRGPTPELIMNQLQKHTAIQARFSCNMIALVDGLPKTLTLKDFLKEFLSFREQVIQKRSQFEKEKASKRLHLVEGFLVGIENLDSVLEIIKTSKSIALAKEDLQSKFNLSSDQAEGLLGMTLRRFTSFESDKLVKEKEELEQRISEIDQLLSRKDMIHDLILKEGLEVAEKYGSKRRTEIVQSPQIELKEIDVIPNNPCIIVYSSKGYIKRMNPNTFSVQGLRGTGVAGTRLKDDESMEDLIFANDHDNLLFFTREGHVHSLPAYSIPSASRTASGTAITQLIRVNRASNIASVLPITSATSDSDVIMLTEKGQIKRTALESFTSMSSRGLIAMKLRESDSLKFVSLCNESEDVLLTSSQGFALRFPVSSCPKLSTSAIGVKTMDIGSGSYVGMRVLPSGAFASETEDEEIGSEEEEPINGPRGTSLVAITKKGMGKCIPIDQIRTNKTRTGKGIKVIKLRNGDELADTVVIIDSDNYKVSDAVISTANGMVVRVPLKQIPSYVNRLTQGNSIVRIRDGDEVSNLAVIQEE